jgi:hypothetical protein
VSAVLKPTITFSKTCLSQVSDKLARREGCDVLIPCLLGIRWTSDGRKVHGTWKVSTALEPMMA